VWDALDTHAKFAAFRDVPREDLAVSTRIFTRAKCRRICEEAFAYAAAHGYGSVTVCEKPNVIRETSGMMLAEARKVHETYSQIQLWDTNIDAQMMWLTKNPEDYGVIVAGNMFGDIISDGFAASANIGKEVGVFEPTHGSAPKYAELDPSIVNPIAMVLSAVMMLDWLGETETASRIRNAVAAVIAGGKVRSYDMLKVRGGPDAISQGAATTTQMTDAIIAAL
jgi:3-isopropylmalate dehydrogenase